VCFLRERGNGVFEGRCLEPELDFNTRHMESLDFLPYFGLAPFYDEIANGGAGTSFTERCGHVAMDIHAPLHSAYSRCTCSRHLQELSRGCDMRESTMCTTRVLALSTWHDLNALLRSSRAHVTPLHVEGLVESRAFSWKVYWEAEPSRGLLLEACVSIRAHVMWLVPPSAQRRLGLADCCP
jgi:hypothetical protein